MADRLNFVDVEHLVAGLSDAKLEQLTLGPLPDGDDASSPWNCRICATLRGPKQSPPATQLLDWHEFETETLMLDDLVLNWRALPDEDLRHRARSAMGELKALAGMLSHARCCTIYALARIELAGRRI
jgi:hypothetical protein